MEGGGAKAGVHGTPFWDDSEVEIERASLPFLGGIMLGMMKEGDAGSESECFAATLEVVLE
jgi:hypothetical protein